MGDYMDDGTIKCQVCNEQYVEILDPEDIDHATDNISNNNNNNANHQATNTQNNNHFNNVNGQFFHWSSANNNGQPFQMSINGQNINPNNMNSIGQMVNNIIGSAFNQQGINMMMQQGTN